LAKKAVPSKFAAFSAVGERPRDVKMDSIFI
jgi:hypothetical protein